MSHTDPAKMSDHVSAEMVECTPDEPLTDVSKVQPVDHPDAPTPTEKSSDATIEQTGAGPPPEV